MNIAMMTIYQVRGDPVVLPISVDSMPKVPVRRDQIARITVVNSANNKRKISFEELGIDEFILNPIKRMLENGVI